MTSEQWRSVWALASQVRALPLEERSEALFSSPQDPYVVETAARLLNLSPAGAAWPGDAAGMAPPVETIPLHAGARAGRPMVTRSVVGGASALLVVAGMAAWSWTSGEWLRGNRWRESPVLLQDRGATPAAASSFDPAVSPDGESVAYSSGGDIFVASLRDGTAPKRLTAAGSGFDYSPAWSPDGRTIAFARESATAGMSDIFVTPAGGGEGHRVATLPVPAAGSAAARKALEWSPDGSRLVVVARLDAQDRYSLLLLTPGSGRLRRLLGSQTAGAAATEVSDSHPAFSPDGRTLAFTRTGAAGESSIALVDLGPGHMPVGEARLLATGFRYNAHPAWTPDGRDLVFAAGASASGSDISLVRMDASGEGKAERISAVGGAATAPAIAREANTDGVTPLVFVRETTGDVVMRQPVGTGANRLPQITEPAHSILAGATLPSLSADGARLAFVRAPKRSGGGAEIWSRDEDSRGGAGKAPVLWARLDAGCGQLTRPRWSAGAAKLVFTAAGCRDGARGGGVSSVYVVDTPGAVPRRLTNRIEDESHPVWTADGQNVLFSSGRHLWKAAAGAGATTPVRLMEREAWHPEVSADGRTLYFLAPVDASSSRVTGLWSVALAPTVVEGRGQLLLRDVSAFSLDNSNAIYYRSPGATGNNPAVILHTDAARRFATPLVATAADSFVATPDGSALLYGWAARTGALVKVAGFH